MQYTAIYDTETMKGVEYSFTAKDEKAAIDYCSWKFYKGVYIKLVNDDTGNTVEFINE